MMQYPAASRSLPCVEASLPFFFGPSSASLVLSKGAVSDVVIALVCTEGNTISGGGPSPAASSAAAWCLVWRRACSFTHAASLRGPGIDAKQHQLGWTCSGRARTEYV